MTNPIPPSLKCQSVSHVAGETVGGLSYCQCRAIAVTNTAPPSESEKVETCAAVIREPAGMFGMAETQRQCSKKLPCPDHPSAPPVEPRSEPAWPNAVEPPWSYLSEKRNEIAAYVARCEKSGSEDWTARWRYVLDVYDVALTKIGAPSPSTPTQRSETRARLLSLGMTEEEAEEDERHDDALEAIQRHVKANCECTTKPHCLRRIEALAREALTEEPR